MIAIEAGVWTKMVLVMRVQTDQLTAAAAARQMAVSRKTYYQLANRGLAGMAAAMALGLGGRPGKVRDPEREDLRAANQLLQQQNLELRQTLRVRESLHEVRVEDGQATEKKTGRAGRRRGGHRKDACRSGRAVSPAQ